MSKRSCSEKSRPAAGPPARARLRAKLTSAACSKQCGQRRLVAAATPSLVLDVDCRHTSAPTAKGRYSARSTENPLRLCSGSRNAGENRSSGEPLIDVSLRQFWKAEVPSRNVWLQNSSYQRAAAAGAQHCHLSIVLRLWGQTKTRKPIAHQARQKARARLRAELTSGACSKQLGCEVSSASCQLSSAIV